MKLRTLLPFSLITTLGCTPQERNITLSVSPTSYYVAGEDPSGIYELGAVDNPSWLDSIDPEIQITISASTISDPQQTLLYTGPYITNGRRAPMLPKLLEISRAIGPDCGRRHPESLDYCPASTQIDEALILQFTVPTYPWEKDLEDNSQILTLSTEDLTRNARILSGEWYRQNTSERERQEREVAEKSLGLK